MSLVNRLIPLCLCAFAVMVFSSCAQMVAPTGGTKDAIPPKVETADPENKNVAFNDKKISTTFDEYITLNNINEQVVISPPLEEKPDFEIKGKTLNVSFKKPLAFNTTYTINFGNAIGDLHENNVLADYTYVFSTGLSLDSAKISGTCINAFNNTPEKDIMVALYNDEGFEDSTIYKTKPVYFSKTKPNGSYIIENISDKTFRLIAFKDENKNLKYDKNEPIAFHTNPVFPNDTNVKSIKLFIYKPDMYEPGKLLDTISREKGKFTFVTYKNTGIPVSTVARIRSFTWLDKGANDIDTFSVYTFLKDSIVEFTFNQKDSIKQFTLNTKKGAKKPVFNITIDKKLELNDTIKIQFSTPVISYDTSRLILKEDTNIIQPVFTKLDENGRYIQFYYKWNEKKRYSLEVKDSAFTNIYEQYNKKERPSWVMKSSKDYSFLKLIINNKTDKQIIFQLTNENETVITKEYIFTGSVELALEYMLPGTYKIKFIEDENRNGKWDNGDYFLKTQPEKVYYFPEKITLRAYWDLEQEIDLKELAK